MTDVPALRGALLEGKVTVDFTKVNGARRIMVCTLNDEFLPPPHPEKDNRAKDENLLIVFDTEQEGWRTIKVDSIIEWSPGANSIIPVAEVPAPIGWAPKTIV